MHTCRYMYYMCVVNYCMCTVTCQQNCQKNPIVNNYNTHVHVQVHHAVYMYVVACEQAISLMQFLSFGETIHVHVCMVSRMNNSFSSWIFFVLFIIQGRSHQLSNWFSVLPCDKQCTLRCMIYSNGHFWVQSWTQYSQSCNIEQFSSYSCSCSMMHNFSSKLSGKPLGHY